MRPGAAACAAASAVRRSARLAVAVLVALSAQARGAPGQSASNITALAGLAPVSVLGGTTRGKAALEANYRITGAIQTGALRQPTLLGFARQQQQALLDAFITSADATELADGLGTTLGAAYQALASYHSPRAFTNVSPASANLFAYTNETTASDSTLCKFALANATTNGTTPLAAAVADSLSVAGDASDVFGKAYRLLAGRRGADRYGNSRPFQTLSRLTVFTGKDFFGAASGNMAVLVGPAQDLRDSPSYPSGHTTYGYMESLLLGFLVPQRFAQEITRAAEYGNDRIILGAHYAMDVIAGRTLALHDVAQLLANHPAYVGQPRHHADVITDYRAALDAARADVTLALASRCRATIAACAAADTGRFSDASADEAFYESTQTYGLPVVYPGTAAASEDFGTLAPEAGTLLTAVFPRLSLAQADAILTATEGPGGGFLDDGSAFGLYSRLDLYAAAKRAAAATAGQ